MNIKKQLNNFCKGNGLKMEIFINNDTLVIHFSDVNGDVGDVIHPLSDKKEDLNDRLNSLYEYAIYMLSKSIKSKEKCQQTH